ncbi:MAG: protein kinase [Myxococcota bacterium]|nr:protein kinase [Myxococcota bacterium]
MTTEAPSSLAEGRYRVVEILGSGGMAKVYRTWDERLQVHRAIKVLNANLAGSSAIRERFLTEARTMARMHHPNIVGVHDIVEDPQSPYMVMELVEGGSLSDWCGRHGAMPPKMACQCVLDMLAALSVAHEAGVVHRDIKPQNILITRSGQTKVTDFGIAQVQSDAPSLTRTGSAMGTLGYMAPEQRVSARDVDLTSDIYAVGATLWSLLRNTQPVDLFLLGMGKAEHQKEGIPESVMRVIERACDYDKEARYASAEEMATALRAAMDALPEDPESATLASGIPKGMPPAHTPPPAQPSSATMIPDALGPVSNPTMALDLEALEEAPLPPSPALPTDSEGSGLTEFEDEEILPVSSPMPKILGGLALLLVLGGGGWMLLDQDPASPPEPDPVPTAVETPPASEDTLTAPELPTPPEVEPTELPEVPEVAPVEQPATRPADKPAFTGRQTEPAPEPRVVEPKVEEPAVVGPKVEDAKVEEPAAKEPTPAKTGAVYVKGDALRVVLVGADGTRHVVPGEVPAGRYSISAAFKDGKPSPAGATTVPAGGSVSLNCVEAFAVCK